MAETKLEINESKVGVRIAPTSGIALMRERDDASLLQAIAAQRDEAAFAELFSRYEKTVFCLAFHIAGSLGIAEEAAQETFLRVWTSAGTYRPGEGEPRPWLLRITERETLKILRKQRKGMTSATLKNERLAIAPAAEVAHGQSEHEELLATIRRLVAELPESARQVMALYFGAGLTQAEIGKELDLSQRAVSYRLSNAMESLRANLAKDGLAAAAPLLAAERFGEALCSGVPVPRNLARRISERLLSAGSDAGRSRTRRDAGVPRFPAGLVAAAVLLAAAGAGAWYWTVQPPRATGAAPSGTPVAKSESPGGQAARTEWHWNFDEGSFEDQLPRTSGWAYARSPFAKRKVLVAGGHKELVNFLKLPVPCDRTLLVEVSASGLGQGRHFILPVWLDEDRMLPFLLHDFIGDSNLPVPALIKWRFYVSGAWIIQCDPKKDDRPSLLYRCQAQANRPQLALSSANWSVTEIALRAIEDTDLPAWFRDPEKLVTKNMQAMVFDGKQVEFLVNRDP